eukprot:CAMPEP_0174372832 /NCGR_PEP_ID=MMETSP0811_2-20130205/104844_1 /TAXON_ID=73025 ORGANISM="Eutreptiella gymnastica-like, Strain CCMP1594" /NCGR_SAMPLE_ID=MMETSP0811_2 /ASSEMBLY_ACC=CAM_ASM_000667 /LENGTH=47 /DNA_ID= /DNA_START= /DNA_END= /DNA_ORIENTATION=
MYLSRLSKHGRWFHWGASNRRSGQQAGALPVKELVASLQCMWALAWA